MFTSFLHIIEVHLEFLGYTSNCSK